MQVLLDGWVWGGASETLRTAKHEIESVADWLSDPGDDEILVYAFQRAQVLVTLDKDFGELAVVHQRPHCGIIRLVSLRAQDQGLAAAMALAKYGQELAKGAIVTVEPGRVRVRPPDSTAM